MEQMKLYTHDEMMDSVIGKKGTPRRDKLDADLKTFLMGEAIKKAREERHLTQEQLGNLIGVKKSQIHCPRKASPKSSCCLSSSHPCTPYRCVGHDLSPKMTRSTCIHHKPYSNVLYVSSLPYLLSFQGLCNCISMQDASSSKSSIRLGNLFSIITESRQSLA